MESDFDRRVLTVPDCTDFGSIPILTVARVRPDGHPRSCDFLTTTAGP